MKVHEGLLCGLTCYPPEGGVRLQLQRQVGGHSWQFGHFLYEWAPSGTVVREPVGDIDLTGGMGLFQVITKFLLYARQGSGGRDTAHQDRQFQTFKKKKKKKEYSMVDLHVPVT